MSGPTPTQITGLSQLVNLYLPPGADIPPYFMQSNAKLRTLVSTNLNTVVPSQVNNLTGLTTLKFVLSNFTSIFNEPFANCLPYSFPNLTTLRVEALSAAFSLPYMGTSIEDL